MNSTGTLLVSRSFDGTLAFWDPASGECLETWQTQSDIVTQLVFSPNDQYLASNSYSSPGIPKLWDVSTGDCLQTFNGHEAPGVTIGFSPDGRPFATGSEDNTPPPLG